MSFNLTGQKIKLTYQQLLQHDSGSGKLYNGLGVEVAVSGASSLSASHANRADVADSFIGSGSLIAIESVTGSYATTGSNIFTANQTITGSIYVSESVETHTLDFTNLNIPAYKAGRMYYNTEDDAVSVYGDVSGVSLQIGQETWVKVVNKTGVTITNGQAVYIDGASGNRPTVRPTTVANHTGSLLIGLATHDIANNDEGYITARGLVRGLNTLAFTEGDTLYLSGSNGGYSASMAATPAHSNKVGTVVASHTNQGIILVNPVVGDELTELHDVCSRITEVDGNLLFYNKTSGLWSGSYARNFILDSNNRVGISTTSPSYSLDVHGDVQITGSLYVTGSILGTTTSASYAISSSFAVTAETLLGSVVSASYAASASTMNGLPITVGSGSPSFESVTGSLYVDNEGYKLFMKTDSGSYWQGIGHRDVAYLYISGTNGTSPGELGCELVAPATWSVSRYNTIYFCDDSQGDMSVILPDSDAYNQGKEMIFVKPRLVTSTNIVTLKTPSDQAITNTTRFDLEGPGDSLQITAVPFIADGAFGYKWRQIAYRLQDRQVLTVGSHGALFTSVSGAIASITDATENNPYLVNVNPGIYIEENPIQLKENVFIQSNGGPRVTIISASNGASDIIFGMSGSILDGFTLKGTTGRAVHISSSGESTINNLIVQDCTTGIEVNNFDSFVLFRDVTAKTSTGQTIDKLFYVKNGECRIDTVKIPVGNTVTTAFHVEGTGSDTLLTNFTAKTLNLSKAIWITSGSHMTAQVVSCTPQVPATNKFGVLVEGSYNSTASSFDGIGLSFKYTDHAFVSNNGANVDINSVDIENAIIGLQVGDTGSNSTLQCNATSVVDSTTWDLQVLSPTGKFIGSGNRMLSTKTFFTGSSQIFTNFVSDVAGDQGTLNYGEFAVGTPEFPAESIFGEGDSYTRGMLVYTFNTGTLAYTDVSVSASTIGDGLTIGFESQSINNMIYVASTLKNSGQYVKHYGVKLSITQAMKTGSGGTAVAEYWNGSTWKRFNTMTTQGSGEYLPYGRRLYDLTGSYQVRYDWRINQAWQPNDPVGYGTNLYWTRYRITAPISRSFAIDQIKVHSNRSEINSDGFIEYFGRARPWATMPWDAGQLAPAAASPVDQDVYLSDTLDVGRLENNFANNATDRIGFNAFTPQDLDTSCPVQLTWAVRGTTTEANNITWNIRWGYSKDGDGIYPDAATAPAFAGNGSQQSMSISVSPPAALNIQKTYQVNLDFSDVIGRRASGSFGDLVWVTLERPSGDPYAGAVTLINVTGRYTKWCAGGHQF